MDYIALGKRIRERRKDKNWTQERLAEKTGISTSFLGHIERGSRVAALDTVVRLSGMLGCGLDDLLVDSIGQDGRSHADDALLVSLLSAVRAAYRRHAANALRERRDRTYSDEHDALA